MNLSEKIKIILSAVCILINMPVAAQQKSKNSVVHFTVDVNAVIPDHSNASLALQDSQIIMQDNGVLLLPESYSADGKPTRLIISCHGAGAGVTPEGSQIESAIHSKYLVSLGYAVMDMNGLAVENMGGPLAVQAYIKGYHWVVENYNIRRDGIFIMGASMGGLTSNNLVYSGSLPILAQAAYCPVLDLYSQAWQHPWRETTRGEIAHWYNFEGYIAGQVYRGEYQPQKIKGFNPVLNRTLEISGIKYKIHPVPLKIWHATEDPVVSYPTSVDFVSFIKNSGGNAELRTLDAKSHEPQSLGPDVGQFYYLGQQYKLKPAVKELGLWFDRFN